MMAMGMVQSFGYTRRHLLEEYRPLLTTIVPVLLAAFGAVAAYLLCDVIVTHSQQFEQMNSSVFYWLVDWSLPLLVVVPMIFTFRVYARFLEDYLLLEVPTNALALLSGGFALCLLVPWYGQKTHLMDGQIFLFFCQLGLLISISGAIFLTRQLWKVSYTLLPGAILGTAYLLIGFVGAIEVPNVSFVDAFAIAIVFNILVCETVCAEMLFFLVKRSLRWVKQ